MPYKDEDTRRAYDRDRKRIGRSRDSLTLSPTLLDLPSDFRLTQARDILGILAEQLEIVRNDDDLKSTERARTIASVCSVALKAIEAGDIAKRIEEIERTLKPRKSA